MMDLADRSLLLNPDSIQALLDGITAQHITHAIGRMQDCDRAVCRLAADLSAPDLDEVKYEDAYDNGYDAGREDGYDDGWVDGHNAGYQEGCDNAQAEVNAAV